MKKYQITLPYENWGQKGEYRTEVEAENEREAIGLAHEQLAKDYPQAVRVGRITAIEITPIQ